MNACAELGLAADISHVTNIGEILELGVMRTPAVVVDGEIAVSGRDLLRMPAGGEERAYGCDVAPPTLPEEGLTTGRGTDIVNRRMTID